MNVAIIGRSEILYDTACLLHDQGHEVVLIITAREAPEYTRTSEDFLNLAEKFGIVCLQTPRINKATQEIRNSRADIGISVNYSGIISQEVIDLFPYGILNAHGGDLPRYRGNACQAWAILNGEERVGLCIHKMVGGELDSGDIIARDYYPINIYTKIEEVLDWMKQRSQELFLEAIDKMETDPTYVLETQSKDPADALRCYPRKPVDGRIDWAKPAAAVLRLINACNKPYAGAFCDYEGEKLIIWDAELVEDQENFLAVPGQITRIGDGFVEVATGQDKLRINQVEYKEKIITPNKIINSIRTRLT